MSDEKTAQKDPVEEILDDMLDGLAEFFPGEMREEARAFVLDASAAHPVTRLLAERVRERAAVDRSGEEIAKHAGEAEAAEKAGGDSQ